MEIKMSAIKQKILTIRGLTGSGKSSWLRHNSDEHNIDRWISADDYFINHNGNYIFEAGLLPNAHANCQQRTRSDLELGFKTIGIHNTFSCRWEMEPYILLAKEFNAEFQVIDLFDGGCTDKELFERNVHDVPLETIVAMRARWEHDWEGGNPTPPWLRK